MDKNKLKQLEKTALLLEANSKKRKAIAESFLKYAEEFLTTLEKQPAYQKNTKSKRKYKNIFSEEPAKLNSIIDFIENEVVPLGINPASAGHLGYIPGGGIIYSAWGDFIAAITNRYSGVYFASPGAVKLENDIIRWVVKLIGYPKSSAGALTSGGSISNLTAIAAARDSKLKSAHLYEKAVVYLTEQAHHSILKALRILGINNCIKNFVAVDKNYRMDVSDLNKKIKEDKKQGFIPWLVIASAGTTDVGAVDPIDDIAKITIKNKLWFHIDAAYGGFFMLTAIGKRILKGINKSDSVTLNPHKSLFLPYGISLVIVRDKQKLLQSNFYFANYMQDSYGEDQDFSPADLSPELSKHFRGLRFWLPLKLLGLKPFRAALEEKIYLARYAYNQLKKIKGIELGPYPELSIVTFRFVPSRGEANLFNEKLTEEILKDGRIFISTTMLDGKFILRFAILSFRTHLKTIDLAIKIIKEKAEYLQEENK